jgi:4-alpha-glucanotransferase
LRLREPDAIAAFSEQEAERIRTWQTALFLFETQWSEIRAHARALGICIAGDMPIYVAHNSVDVWANRGLFQLDSDGELQAIAGCPPDAYATQGQFWRNPLYDWESMAREDYRWWIRRVARCLEHCDALRLDHFIGFSRYWSIPSGATSATEGCWKPGPGRAIFDALSQALGELPLFAEDLGKVDAATIALRENLELPGMRVLQFGLDGKPGNPNHPSAYPPLSIASTGTHDAPTAAGWWSDLSASAQSRLDLGRSPAEAAEAMVDWVLQSQSCWTIFPLADLLGLGNEARINRPGTTEGNWVWREAAGARTPALAAALHRRIQASGRT